MSFQPGDKLRQVGSVGMGSVNDLSWWGDLPKSLPGRGEAPEEPDERPAVNRENVNRSISRAWKRAEPWPTMDHGSARLIV
jgi:hypothetical protein